MTSPCDDTCVPIPCPNCGTAIPKTIGWLLHNDHIGCDCGARLRIDASPLRADLAARSESQGAAAD